jgi:hypothetical protein
MLLGRVAARELGLARLVIIAAVAVPISLIGLAVNSAAAETRIKAIGLAVRLRDTAALVAPCPAKAAGTVPGAITTA